MQRLAIFGGWVYPILCYSDHPCSRAVLRKWRMGQLLSTQGHLHLPSSYNEKLTQHLTVKLKNTSLFLFLEISEGDSRQFFELLKVQSFEIWP